MSTFKAVLRLEHAKQAATSTRFLTSLAVRAPQAKLVTIPASSYAEKARWALRMANIPFVEEKWAPLLVYLSTMPKGGRSVPLLTMSSRQKVTLTDSADIVALCVQTSPELRPSERTQELESYFDAKLGPHSRRCGLQAIQEDRGEPHRQLGSAFHSAGDVPCIEATVVMLRAMNINAASAERSWLRIEAILAEAEEKLGDGPVGSRFLAGDTFSSADIAVCSHVALLVLPPEHEFIAPYISMDSIQDPVFRARFEKLRSSKIGQYVLPMVLQPDAVEGGTNCSHLKLKRMIRIYDWAKLDRYQYMIGLYWKRVNG